MEDPALVARLADARIALTVCPLSNLKLRVFDDMAKHTLKALLDQGVAVMINSDDPAYFGGYVNANYFAITEALNLTDAEVYTLLKNSLEASFVTEAERHAMVARLDAYWNNGYNEQTVA
jgi:adenosine deaminase